jgi:hypothetical protein
MNGNQRPRRIYFEPDVVILVLELDGGSDDQIAARLASALTSLQSNQGFGVLGLLDLGSINGRQVIGFTHVGGGALEQLQLPPHRRPRRSTFALALVKLRTPLPNRHLLRLIELTNRMLPADGEGFALDSGLWLRALSPNWLFTPAPEVAGGGGPGTRPVPVDAAVVPEPHQKLTVGQDDLSQTRFGFTIEQALFGLNPQDSAQQVEVAILDTAPLIMEWKAALAAWSQQHPLLRSLGMSGMFNIIEHSDPAWNLRLPQSTPPGQSATAHELRVRDHDYSMRDHGLFVAGIIHTIAPAAHIRLIEILNEYGVGYLDTIARAFRQLQAEHLSNSTPLVVNCSLTLTMPLGDHWQENRAEEDDLEEVTVFRNANGLAGRDPAQLSPREREILDQLDLLSLAIEWVCTSLYSDNITIVAAAGNDAGQTGKENASPRPQARCPAAFPSVVGVGALDRGFKPATYSNWADRQARQGLATFGGEEDMVTIGSGTGRKVRKAKAGQAVLGAYIGPFPDDGGGTITNGNGWAWWSGTSFAAPIVSGALAWLVGNRQAPTLAMAHRALILEPDPLFFVGDVLKVRQGP